LMVVQPETVLQWHRQWLRRRWAPHLGNRTLDFGSLGSGPECPNRCGVLFGEPRADIECAGTPM
jgi:hypothetical protein